MIAEAAGTHGGDLYSALTLIHAARDAGANACKFQWVSSPERLCERRNAHDYKGAYGLINFPQAWHAVLQQECEAGGIEYMCTVYLPEDIATIAPFVKRFKIASFEASDDAFRESHLPYGKEIIVSTGMTDEEEFVGKWWILDVTRLHCVSAYPTPLEQANLAALRSFYNGYSDHTHNVLTGALAVAAGARILEVHFRLDDTDSQNPDYATALSPGQLKDYISLVRQAEVMMGSGVKAPQPAEAEMMKYRVRK